MDDLDSPPRSDDLEPDSAVKGAWEGDNFPRIEQKLLDRSVKRMKSLVNGNGVDPDQVSIDEYEDIRQYRFPARVQIKLVSRFGVRIEPGRNTLAELAGSKDEFQKKIHGIILTTRTTREKRQQVIDFIFSRSDKGFGIESQRTLFKNLTHDVVMHEQCHTCAHSGDTACPRCHGKGGITCSRCRGRRQIHCTKCGGSGHMHTPQGSRPCDMCRASGNIPCSLCHSRGLMKCNGCAASGRVRCQKCSGTGWLSHLAHIELEGIIHFGFDRTNLPSRLAELVADRGATLVKRGDLSVDMVPDVLPGTKPDDDLESGTEPVNREEDTMIYIDYDVTCPYGPIHFKVADRVVPAIMLGWQARLIDAPPFIEDFTKTGMEAIREAASGTGPLIELLHKACRFAVWRELISQILLSGNLKQVMDVLFNRYPTGLDYKHMQELIPQADLAVRLVTRRSRYIGMSAALVAYLGVVFLYYIETLRDVLGSHMPHPALMMVADALLAGAGVGVGVLGGKLAAIVSRNKAFAGIVPQEILSARLPRAGATALWSLGLSILGTLAILFYGYISGSALPDWLGHFLPR